MQKEAKAKGLANLLNIVKKPLLTAGAVGGAGLVGSAVGKHKGKKEMAEKFRQYNEAENRMIAQRAYQIGLRHKQAQALEEEIIENIAIEKIANGFGKDLMKEILA